MTAYRLGALLSVLVPLWALGCAENAAPVSKDKEAKIQAALAQLDLADRERAEEQKYCAVQKNSRLGSMGKPIKLTIKDETIFVCCEGCEKEAKKDPNKTLTQVEENKIRAGLEQLSPEDRELAQEQKYCAVDPESRLDGAAGQGDDQGSAGLPLLRGLREEGEERPGQDAGNGQEAEGRQHYAQRVKPRITRITRMKDKKGKLILKLSVPASLLLFFVLFV